MNRCENIQAGQNWQDWFRKKQEEISNESDSQKRIELVEEYKQALKKVKKRGLNIPSDLLLENNMEIEYLDEQE